MFPSRIKPMITVSGIRHCVYVCFCERDHKMLRCDIDCYCFPFLPLRRFQPSPETRPISNAGAQRSAGATEYVFGHHRHTLWWNTWVVCDETRETTEHQLVKVEVGSGYGQSEVRWILLAANASFPICSAKFVSGLAEPSKYNAVAGKNRGEICVIEYDDDDDRRLCRCQSLDSIV